MNSNDMVLFKRALIEATIQKYNDELSQCDTDDTVSLVIIFPVPSVRIVPVCVLRPCSCPSHFGTASKFRVLGLQLLPCASHTFKAGNTESPIVSHHVLKQQHCLSVIEDEKP